MTQEIIVDPSVFVPNPQRQRYAQVITAALAAVDPYTCVRHHLQRVGDHIRCGGRIINLGQVRHIYVLGFGKAAGPMAQAVEDVLGERITEGLVIVKEGHHVPTRRVRVREAAHPVPDERSVDAARELLRLAQQAGPEDMVVVLISGGGSALFTLPAEGLTLTDLQQTTDLLLKSGATIHEINTVRKHCSAVKGGWLAHHLAPATTIGLILSDVVGNPLDVIASGPLSPDPTTYADAWQVLEKYELVERIPPAVRDHLQAGRQGRRPETPKPDDPLFEQVHLIIVGDNARAAEAAAREALALGYNAEVLTTFLEGEAREVARVVTALAKEVSRHHRPLPPPACLILGGETTVTVRGSGKGGRNQELALAAAIALAGWPHITLIALGTDGTDGPTDAAGGMVDGQTVARAHALGLDPLVHLRENNAYPLLHAVHDLVKTGPTRTNVNDLIFLFVEEGTSPHV